MRFYLQIIIAALVSTAVAHADERYVPQSLYAYERLAFENGFQVILNPREGAANVSLRLVVSTGLGDFACAERELPHLVEHLMFSGTSRHSEAELEQLVSSLGGDWNAGTFWEKAVYEMDIFSGNADTGIEILHQLFTDTQITNTNLGIARELVYLEAGGAPGVARQFMHRRGLIEGSISKSYREFIPESSAYCDRIPTTEHLSVTDLIVYMSAHHVPQNMLLIAVGDFDANKLGKTLQRTFGALPSAEQPAERESLEIRSQPRTQVRYETRLDPLVANTTRVALDFAVALEYGVERVATDLITNYLRERLYEDLRIERGLAYSPMASVYEHGDFATLILEAEVAHGNADRALDIIQALVEDVAREGIPEEKFQQLRQSLLYSHARRYESNASISRLYTTYSQHLMQDQPLPNFQATIAAVDADTVRTVAAKRLRMDQVLVYVAAPTMTYGQLAALVFLIAVLVSWLVWRRYRANRVRRDSWIRDRN